MAVEKRWIKISLITVGVILLFFVLCQIALVATFNALVGSASVVYGADIGTSLVVTYITLNSSIELVALCLFVVPAIWLGIAAATSRHRGVYIMHAVVAALAFLSVVGMIVYEVVAFGVNGWYRVEATAIAQGFMVTRLVLWCIITVLLIIYISVSVAAHCTYRHRREKPEFRYQDYGGQGARLGYYPTIDYTRPPPLKASPREYPRLVAPPTARYDYPASPKAYYPPRY